MKTKSFIIKVLMTFDIVFDLTGVSKKNRHSSVLISVKSIKLEATFTYKIKCSSFLFYIIFLAYILIIA